MMLREWKQAAAADDHIFIVLECEGRPTISIDITGERGGGRYIGVRMDGMCLISAALDIAPLVLPPREQKPFQYMRFCPICGGKIDSFSSAGHACPNPLPSDTF